MKCRQQTDGHGRTCDLSHLSSVLYTSRSTTNDDHVQQPPDLLLSLALKSGSLNAVHQPRPDLLSVPSLLQEAGILRHARDAERLVRSADVDDEVVVRNSRLGASGLDLRVVSEGDGLALEVDVGRFGFDHLDGSLLVPGHKTGGLDN